MNHKQIEEAARFLQLEIYNSRFSLWRGQTPPVPLEMCAPHIGAKVLGVNFEEAEDLGRFGNSEARFEVAGFINRDEGRIVISKRFKSPIRRFTAAHELGHWVLHEHKVVLHRDLPISGIGSSRNPRHPDEQEADYFAACFLVSKKQLLREFEARFGRLQSFRFDDTAAFGLNPSNPSQLLTSPDDSLEWEAALSSSIRYHGIFFESLADVFKVSTGTMAIRLREMGLGK